MKLGEKIKLLRKEKGFTQQELAKNSNISRSYLADVEGNRYNPSIDTLRTIASALGTSLSSLISDTDADIQVDENIEHKKRSPEVETIAAHLEDKNLTPHKVKMIKRYIDDLFSEFDE